MKNSTAGDIDSVNHVGIAVHDLDHAAALYERMGFTLSALSVHAGSTQPGEPVQPMATGNRCAIFPNNYIELLGIVNPGKMDWGWGRFLEKFQGAHIVCFGCGDAATVDTRLKQAGVASSGVVQLRRDVETPTGEKTAAFECVHFPARPEGLIQAAHHLTPELIHQPRHLSHKNGVTALSEVVFVSPKPAEMAASYATLTGGALEAAGGRDAIELPNGNRLRFLGLEDFAVEFPGSMMAPPPCIAAIGFSVADLDATERALKAGGFRTARAPHRLLVPAEDALGAVHFFAQAQP